MTLSALQQESIEILMLLKSERGKELSRMLWRQYHISQILGEYQTKKKLFSLTPGAPVPADVEVDVLRADTVGKTLMEDLIQNQLSWFRINKLFFQYAETTGAAKNRGQ